MWISELSHTIQIPERVKNSIDYRMTDGLRMEENNRSYVCKNTWLKFRNIAVQEQIFVQTISAQIKFFHNKSENYPICGTLQVWF